MKEVSLEKAAEYYVKSCELYITEGREQFAQETFKKTLSILLKSKKSVDFLFFFSFLSLFLNQKSTSRLPEAIDILKKQTQAYQKADNKPLSWKCFLSTIILHLANTDLVEANKQYQAFLQSVPPCHISFYLFGGSLLTD